ncbi:hypothetical protein ACFX14_003063 [Malus domestica]
MLNGVAGDLPFEGRPTRRRAKSVATSPVAARRRKFEEQRCDTVRPRREEREGTGTGLTRGIVPTAVHM